MERAISALFDYRVGKGLEQEELKQIILDPKCGEQDRRKENREKKLVAKL